MRLESESEQIGASISQSEGFWLNAAVRVPASDGVRTIAERKTTARILEFTRERKLHAPQERARRTCAASLARRGVDDMIVAGNREIREQAAIDIYAATGANVRAIRSRQRPRHLLTGRAACEIGPVSGLNPGFQALPTGCRLC